MGWGPHPPDRLSCPDDGPTSARPASVDLDAGACARTRDREKRRASAGHQPSSHEPGDGRLSPSTTSLSWTSSWPTNTSGSLAPTRSARTPPVAQSPPCRSELRRRTSLGPTEVVPTTRRFRHAAHLFAGSPPRGRARSPPVDPLAQAALVTGPVGGGALRVCTPHAASPGTVGKQTTRAACRLGLRVASPTAPRRVLGSAAPEVPSIIELPLRDPLDFRPESPTLAWCCPQLVTSLWTHATPFSPANHRPP